MRFIISLAIVFGLTACGNSSDEDSATEAKKPQQSTSVKQDTTMPKIDKAVVAPQQAANFSEYPGTCPEAWGIVNGAAFSHVENFIQNYFHVPESSGAMYSRIDYSTLANGAQFVNAGTYNMLDDIVDQEMIASFTGGVMTQCGVRLRCASNKNLWVGSCD